MSERERVVRETEEDLTTGPTPDSRRADGEAPSEHDTSEGPTPETREAERVDEVREGVRDRDADLRDSDRDRERH